MKPTIANAASGTKNTLGWWLAAGLVLAIAAAYWPVAGYAFTYYDDNDYIWQNPHVLAGLTWRGVVWAFAHLNAGNWHPVTWLSHMLDVQLYGARPGGHHVTNVLFHAANAVLLLFWLRRLTGYVWRSAVVAALFALHPLHVESVAWVAERKDVLSTFFMLLSLMAYTRYAETQRQKAEGSRQKLADSEPAAIRHLPSAICYLLSLGGFALGLMSKPMLVTLPFVLLLLDYWPLQRFPVSGFRSQVSAFKDLVWEKIPFFVLSAAMCGLTFVAQKNGKAMMNATVLPLGDRVQNACIAYGLYLKKMVWPEGLAAFYPLALPINEDAVLLAAAGLLVLSALVFAAWRSRPYLALGWLWYLGMLVPVIGLIQVGSQALADRYTYVPLIGIFIALVWLVAEVSATWPYRRPILIALAAGGLAVCWQLTAAQVRVWQNSETLARHALSLTAKNVPMEMVLGNALIEQGRLAEASQHYNEVLTLVPNSVPALGDLALALFAQGRLDEAAAKCREALRYQPDELKMRYVLAGILAQQGKTAETVVEYEAMLQIDPNHLVALNNLAWLLATAPDAQVRNGVEAVRLSERACRLTQDRQPMFIGTLAAAYAEAGRFDEAIATAQKAMALATAAKSEDLVRKNRELLEIYQQKKPYHEPAR